MKHPALEEKLGKIEYEKHYKKHAGRYLAWSLSGLVFFFAVVYFFVRPDWPPAVVAILYTSGFVLCVSASALLGKRRARTLLEAPKLSSRKSSALDE